MSTLATQSWDAGTSTPTGWTLPAGYSVVAYNGASGTSSPNALRGAIGATGIGQAVLAGADANGGDVAVASTFAWDATPPNGSTLNAAVLLRVQGGSTGQITTATQYVAGLDVTGTGGQVSVSRWPAGATLGTPATFPANTFAPNTAYRLTAVARGTSLSVSVRRVADGLYLLPSGVWVSGPVTYCYTVTDGVITGAGATGLYLGANGANLYADDYAVLTSPPAVGTVSVGASTTTTTSLTATAATPASSATIAGYQLYRSQTYGQTPSPATLVAGATSTTLTDTGLAPGSVYYYFLGVTDSAGATAYYPQAAAMTLPTLAYNLVFAGNSLTQGAHASAGNDYPSQCLRLLGPAYAGVPAAGATTTKNLGIGGQTTATLPNPNPAGYQRLTDTAATVDAALVNGLLNVLVPWDGTNEIAENPGVTTGASAYAAMVAYCLARRAAGWDRIIVVTVLPRQLQPGVRGDFEVQRQAYNGLMRTGWPAFADGLYDVAADARIGQAGDEVNPTYYYLSNSADSAVHLIDAGYAVVAAGVAGIVAATVSTGRPGSAATVAALQSAGVPLAPAVATQLTAIQAAVAALPAGGSSTSLPTGPDGYVRVSVGTGAGQLNLASGSVVLNPADPAVVLSAIVPDGTGRTVGQVLAAMPNKGGPATSETWNSSNGTIVIHRTLAAGQ